MSKNYVYNKSYNQLSHHFVHSAYVSSSVVYYFICCAALLCLSTLFAYGKEHISRHELGRNNHAVSVTIPSDTTILDTQHNSIPSSIYVDDDFADIDLTDLHDNTPPTHLQLQDKSEKFNKQMLKLNKSLQHKFFDPLAISYKKIVHNSKIRKWVLNFFHNLAEPTTAINALAQFNFKGLLIASTRFIMNSTVGMLGVYDFASAHRVRPLPTGFGETLAFYGIPSGSYLILPIIGPTTTREGIGTIMDWFLDPVDLVLIMTHHNTWSYVHLAGEFVSTYAEQVMELSKSIADISLDEYAMMRSIYTQALSNRKTFKQRTKEYKCK